MTNKIIVKDYEGMMNMGMQNVDPVDIKPPEILMIHATSKLSQFQDKEGNRPTPGQLFHSGKLQLFDADTDSGVEDVGVNCHVLYVSPKTEWSTTHEGKANDYEGYRIVGVMEDMSLFSFMFKNTGINALSKLFTAVHGQRIPMFMFPCVLQTKYLEGKVNSFWIPVLRIGDKINDEKLINDLYLMAKGFDKKVNKVTTTEEDAEEVFVEDENKEALPWEK